ncbi:MAG: response regulator [Bdellovibrionales bacterium]|nr:response regulator [Bdellovibrionales bacterium]
MEQLYPDSSPQKLDLSKPNVLAVEDNSLEAHLIVSTLGDDYNVFFAKNGIEGLKILKQQHIDCIVCDLKMPKMGGKTFLKCVQRYKKYREIPFLILTIKSDLEEIVSHLYSGATDYIQKPFHVDILKARVHTNVQHSYMKRKLLTYGDATFEGKFGYYRENEMSKQSMVFDKLGKELHVITEVIDHLISGNPTLANAARKKLIQKKQSLKMIFDTSSRVMSQICTLVDSLGEDVDSPKEEIDSYVLDIADQIRF